MVGCGVTLCRRYFVFVLLILLVEACPAAAAGEVTTFGPQRFDRLKGAPTVYTETFRGCSAADRVLLQVWNGDAKATRITAAEILVNGRAILVENDFKKADAYLERRIDTKGVNDLKITLKSGDYKEPSFLRLAVLSNGCDTTPPTIFDPSPVDSALLATARPLIAAAYSDGVEADASGIDPASAQLTLDGVAITATTRNATGIRYLPPDALADGLHSVTLDVADRVGNRASRSWSFFIDTTPPVITVTSPANQALSPVLAVQISGTLSEAASLVIAGQSVTLNGDSFEHPLLLTPGSNTITLVAVDAAGNRGSTTLTLWADNTPPIITVVTPAANAIVNTPQISVSGTLSEEVATLTINGRSVIVSGTSFTLADLDLLEGANEIRIVAFDRAGNRGEAQVTVMRDSTPPPAPLFTPPLPLTHIPQLTLSGQAEGGVNVTLLANDSGASLAVVAADAAGAFVFPELTLAEGENRFSAFAVDAAANRSEESNLLVVTLDTIAPQLAITAPLTGTIGNQRIVTVTGTTDDSSATLTLNGQPVTLNGATFSHPVELQLGSNTLTLSAVDLAGNHSSATVQVEFDDIPPVITVTTPPDGLLTNAAQVTISGEISESRCTVELGGTALTVSGENFSGVVDLQDGENSLTLTASDRAGNRGSALLIVRSDRTPPTLAIIAPVTAVAGETLRLRITANDSSGLTLVETSAANRPFAALAAPAAPAAPLEQSLVYTLSPDLAPATNVVLALRGLDGAGNSAIVTTTVTISAGPSGPGYLQGEVYDDHSGLRLSGVTVRVMSAGTNREVVSAEDGGYLFELPAGDYQMTLAKAGYTTLYRQLTIRPEQTVTALDARLTALAPAVAAGYSGRLLSAPLEAGPAWSGPNVPALTVVLPEGALSESHDAALTPLSSQGLPTPLPRGWSPLAALDLRFTAAGLPLPDAILFFYPAILRLPLGDSGLSAGDELTVARYDLASGVWLAQTTAIVSSDATAAVASLSREGIYALLLADPAPLTPPQPSNGEALAATTATADDLNGWLVSGEVAPAAAPPALGLRAVGEVRIAPGAELSAESRLASGLLLRGRVTESFDLFSGEAAQPSDYVQDLLLYRTPCLSGAGAGRIAPTLADGLRTSFPVTPSHQYTIAKLLQGEVGIAIVPPEMEQSGVLAGPDGALLLTDDGIALLLPAGALERTVPVQLQSLAATAVAPLVPEGFALLAAVRIDLSRQSLQTGALLSLPLPAAFDPLRPVVLAQVFTAGGGERLRGVAFLKPVGSLLTSVTEVGGVALPGIRAGGTYCLLQSESLLGLVRGTVRSASSQPFSGALVTANRGSLADLSLANGSYLLFAPLGQVHVSALDLSRFDRGEASATLAYTESVLTLDPVIRATVPSVVALTPDNGASGVDPAARISITFSEPVERSSITSASIVLSRSDNTPVAGVFSFSPDATIVSFYPEARLVSEGRYTIAIASSVRDLQGYGLAAPLTASFIVRDTTPPPMPPAGSISATFPDEEGMITVTATQGSAEYDATVLIINDTSGEIVSIAPFSNGSFNARIHGQLGDEIQVVLMDNAGNQTLISYLTFTAPDGRTLVTAKGGKVAGEGGLLLELPAGALVGPAVVKIVPVTESELPHPVPAEARFIGAVSIDSGGLSFAKEVELSIPLPADLPAGAFPFLAQPVVHTNPDGTQEEVYQLIDTVKIVNGRLTTASPPFDGVMTVGIFAFLFLPSPQIGPVVVSGSTYRDLNGQPGYQPNPDPVREVPTTTPSGELLYNYDQPINGAVIRSPGGYNFIAYSDRSGHYAAFGFSVVDACRPFTVTAINPQTMFRNTANLITCEAPHFVNHLNFKLADKETTVPDKIPPVIDLGLQVVAGQIDDPRLIAGTVPVGTNLSVPIGIVDQDVSFATLVIEFKTPDMPTAQIVPMALNSGGRQLHTPMQGETPALFRYTYIPQFSGTFAGATPETFRPDRPGTYTLVVEVTDGAGNRASRRVQVRAVDQGEQAASIDGAPQVDSILPADGSREIMVTTPVIVTFSEPVENVTAATLQLLDAATGSVVPTYLYNSLEAGRMRATLQPQHNLQFAHDYTVVITTAITDLAVNPGFGNVKLPLAHQTGVTFTTKTPRAFDLSEVERFSSGFDLDRYDDLANQRSYAYVSARENGWRTIDITDPTTPRVVYTRPPLANISFRGVGVDQQNGVLGISENIVFADGGQYGYVRFYDLGADPINPPKFGQEKLAEAYSGIPGRLGLADRHAYVATVGAGVQAVDSETAHAHVGASDGSSIVGVYDSIGQGYGHPNDVQFYTPGKAVVTTNSGYLLLLDTGYPAMPQLLGSFPGNGKQATRAAAVSSYSYNQADGTAAVIDLAVIAGLGTCKPSISVIPVNLKRSVLLSIRMEWWSTSSPTTSRSVPAPVLLSSLP